MHTNAQNLRHYKAYAPHELPFETDSDWIFFYGGPFSNFAPSAIVIEYPQPWHGDGSGSLGAPYRESYATVEHFFQASKAAAGFDHEMIRTADSPGESKSRGNSRQSWAPGCAHLPLLREDWEDVKYEVMVAGLREKFAMPNYMPALLATSGSMIAEDSPTDFIWGIRDERGGFTGENLLGKALMEVRTELEQ